MLVKNESTGKTEAMRHGPATAAVAAGTHSFVNLDEAGKVKAERKKKVEKPAEASGS